MEILTVMLFGQGNDSSDNDLWAWDYANLTSNDLQFNLKFNIKIDPEFELKLDCRSD